MVVRKTFNPKSRSDVRGWVTLVRWRWCSHRWGRWKYNEYHHRFESCPDYKNIDSGIPHSIDVDNLEWNRNSWPSAEASLKLRKQLRLEREGYSITINNIVLFPWERNQILVNVIQWLAHNTEGFSPSNLVRWRNGRRTNRISKVVTPLQFTGSNPVLTTKKIKLWKK